MHVKVLLTLIVAAGLSFSDSSAYGTEPVAAPAARVQDFTLRDYRGKEHALSDFADAKVVVLAVLGTECPLAKLYASRLQEIFERYSDRDVVFVGLNANSQDSITEIASHARRHGLTFPVLKDVGNEVVDSVGATRTPEVIVLDSERIIRYRGRIDDQYGIGYAKESPSETYLIDAIEALLASRPVAKATVEPIGCLIGRTRPAEELADVTYAGQIAAILNERCVQCHREGEIAPFALTDYESAAGWADMIAEVVRENRMPPWHAAEPVTGTTSHDKSTLTYQEGLKYANDRRLSDKERDALMTWASAGAPRGTGPVLPVPTDEVSDWRLPREPDAVIAMAEEPFHVPADGAVRYQYFRVDPDFTEDKWVQGAEIIPGNRAVVHHVLVFARKAGDRDGLDEGGRGFVAAYVPGLEPAIYPPGMAKLIEAGSELIFQVHYTPIGSPQTDISKVGFIFADPAEIKHVVETRNAVTRRLLIEPHEADQKFEASDSIRHKNALLLAMMPHMHLRGQAFRYTLVRGDERWTLLDVPRYDFNWQTGYGLAEPLSLKQGDRIHCEAWFDNSPENLANPDPSATVHWGDQTWDEMMIGYYDIALPLDADGAKELIDRVGQQVQRTIDQYDADGDGEVAADEVPMRLRALHKQLDRNADGRVTSSELRSAFERQSDSP